MVKSNRKFRKFKKIAGGIASSILAGSYLTPAIAQEPKGISNIENINYEEFDIARKRLKRDGMQINNIQDLKNYLKDNNTTANEFFEKLNIDREKLNKRIYTKEEFFKNNPQIFGDNPDPTQITTNLAENGVFGLNPSFSGLAQSIIDQTRTNDEFKKGLYENTQKAELGKGGIKVARNLLEGLKNAGKNSLPPKPHFIQFQEQNGKTTPSIIFPNQNGTSKVIDLSDSSLNPQELIQDLTKEETTNRFKNMLQKPTPQDFIIGLDSQQTAIEPKPGQTMYNYIEEYLKTNGITPQNKAKINETNIFSEDGTLNPIIIRGIKGNTTNSEQEIYEITKPKEKPADILQLNGHNYNLTTDNLEEQIKRIIADDGVDLTKNELTLLGINLLENGTVNSNIINRIKDNQQNNFEDTYTILTTENVIPDDSLSMKGKELYTIDKEQDLETQLSNLFTNKWKLDPEKKPQIDNVMIFSNQEDEQKINPIIINYIQKKINDQHGDTIKVENSREVKTYKGISDLNANFIPEDLIIETTQQGETTIYLREKKFQEGHFKENKHGDLEKEILKTYNTILPLSQFQEKIETQETIQGKTQLKTSDTDPIDVIFTSLAGNIFDASFGQSIKTNKQGKIKNWKDLISNYAVFTNPDFNPDDMAKFLIEQSEETNLNTIISQKNFTRLIDNLAYIQAIKGFLTDPENQQTYNNHLTPQAIKTLRNFEENFRADEQHPITNFLYVLTTEPQAILPEKLRRTRSQAQAINNPAHPQYKQVLNNLGDATTFLTNFLNVTKAIPQLDGYNIKGLRTREHFHPSTGILQVPIYLEDDTTHKTTGFLGGKHTALIPQTGLPDKLLQLSDENHWAYMRAKGINVYQNLTKSWSNLITGDFANAQTSEQLSPQKYEIQLKNGGNQ